MTHDNPPEMPLTSDSLSEDAVMTDHQPDKENRTMDPEPVAFVASLEWHFRELLDALREHLADNDGEILAHPFMGDIRRWAEGLATKDQARLTSFLNHLEQDYEHSDPSVKNLIEVSFVEQLPYPDEPNAEIRDLLPPNLKALLWHGLRSDN